VNTNFFITFAYDMEERKVLVVDDEQDLCDILLFNLTAAGYTADTVYSAEEALEILKEKDFDLLLLDVMMPGMSGFELAKLLKANPRTSRLPVIFLTAKDSESDMLHGFDAGADDYVTKPFSVREVMARVKAVLNRSLKDENPMVITYEGLTADSVTKTACIDGKDISLTKTEFEVLYLLLTHREQVFSRQQLLEIVWPQGVIVTNRSVDVSVARLRKKLGRYSVCIITRQGFGYCFEEK